MKQKPSFGTAGAFVGTNPTDELITVFLLTFYMSQHMLHIGGR